MSLVLASSGGGSITIQDPVTAANTSLTVPAVNGGVAVTDNDKIGYYTGLGGTVTQVTSRTTGVTLNKLAGSITLVSAAGSTTAASFTVTNSLVSSADVVVLSQQTGANTYDLMVTAVAAGSFRITVRSTGGSATEAPIINFVVIKGATS